jgi:hypothetical protein
MSTLKPLNHVQHELPFTLASVYTGFARGRYPWVKKAGPDGHVGRNLWIDVECFNAWAKNRGLKLTRTPPSEPMPLASWQHNYNWHRPHSGIGGIAPINRLKSRNNLLTLHT